MSLQSRYGLSFGATMIVASRFNTTTGTTELTVFPASPDYRSLYALAVQRFQMSDDDVDEVKVKSIFKANAVSVIEGLTIQAGHAPEFATLFLPSVFDWKVRSVAADAVFADAQYATKIGQTRAAACYGYGFLEGKNLGRPISECNDDGPKSLVLLFEYEKEYIYAWLMEVEFELGTYVAEQDHMCKECGEGHHKAIGAQAYQERVNAFVHDFIELEVLANNKREDIRAIVISGEASVAGVKELANVALDTVGTEDVKLMTNFEPSEVVAHGAAVFARITEEHPEYFLTRSTNIVPDDAYLDQLAERRARKEEEHSEL